MDSYQNTKSRNVCHLIIAAIYLACTPAFALSRMGTATITDLDGTPCFSIPENIETRKGLPLWGLYISELPNGDRDNLPPTVWSFSADDYDAPPILFPSQCILYGDSPAGTTQRSLNQLQPLKVYSIFLKAKHEGSSMIGYSGEFCIKPAGPGRAFVQVISEDRSLGDARFSGCHK